MKLSEAIRAGAKIRPQARGALVRLRWWAAFWPFTKPASCALGAAFEAVGCEPRPETPEEFERGRARPFRGEQTSAPAQIIEHPLEWNAVWYSTIYCPQCDVSDAVYRLVPHLNDDHKWKREEIALFVERLENAVEETQAPEPVWRSVEEQVDVLDASEIG